MTLFGMDLSILGPGLLAGLLVTTTHVPLGRQVLERGIIFIDLAIAQIAALGVLLAHSWNGEQGVAGVQATAFGAALLGALMLYVCERRWPEVLEALIGTSFVLAATASILMLASDPQSGEHLKELLVGQILWVSYDELLPVAALYTLILLAWFKGSGTRRPVLFYVLLPLAVTASVQLVGIYLVFASLIIPALAARRRRRSLSLGYAVSIAGFAAGLPASALLDLPTGAVIVWTLAVSGLLIALATRPLATASEV